MRTVPTAIGVGLSSGYRMFYLVKIEGRVSADADTLYYWTTAGKNNDGNAMTLKETSGGGSLTYDSGMIAMLVNGESRDGIGRIEAGIDIETGGASSAVSDIKIEILNQERFDKTITSTNVKLENRPITLYMGFIPGGASPTVVIQSDMIKLYSGIIEHLNNFDFSDFSFDCIDSSFARHKDVPSTIVETATYPYAPKESVGKPIPIVYGSVSGSESADRDYETISPFPTVKTSYISQTYAISDHELHTYTSAYVYSPENNLFGLLASGDITSSNTSSGATLSSGGNNVIATFRQIPNLEDTETSVDVDITNAVDQVATNYVDLGASKKLYARLEVPQEVGELVDSTGGSALVTIRMDFDTIASGNTATIKYFTPTETATTPDVTDADGNTTVTRNTAAGVTWTNLGNWAFGITTPVGATSVRVKHICIEYHVKMFSRGRPRAT